MQQGDEVLVFQGVKGPSVPPPGIKIPESCVHRVREELKQMDEDVKRKHSRLLQAQEQSSPFSLPPHMLPGLPLPSLCQDEILDLTYSPPSNSIADVVLNPESRVLCFSSEPSLQPQQPQQQQHRLSFGFGHAPGLEGRAAPGPSLHESPALPPPAPPQQPQEDFLQQDGNINFREILEDMLRTFNGPSQENLLAPERQSVIQFSGPFPDF